MVFFAQWNRSVGVVAILLTTFATASSQQTAPNTPPAAPTETPQVIATPQAASPIPTLFPMSATTFYARSPYRSISQNDILLDSLGLKVVLALDYRKGVDNEAAWKLPGMPGVKGSRQFLKKAGDAVMTIELGFATAPQGGYDFILYGTQTQAGTQAPNPDLADLQLITQLELTRIAAEPANVDFRQLSYETYTLSYVDADRAMAVLKTLGYTTVEYTGDAAEGLYDKIYKPVQQGGGSPPIIVKLIDPTKTSLMDPEPQKPLPPGQYPQLQVPTLPQQQQQGGTVSAVPQIGGTFLHQATTGEPEERLLILYDKDQPETLQNILNLMREKVDVASRQIMIEALVVEVSADNELDLGLTLNTSQNKVATSFNEVDAKGVSQPFIFSIDSTAAQSSVFQAKINALVAHGKAQILSSPSVLVLDGRQARIQIGQQVPVVKSVSTPAGIISSVDYFPVGIVLNLRPRISEDGKEVTMQAQTIVSAVNQQASAPASGVTQISPAPVVDNREVQSFVRVANDTPFIIGGLIATNDNQTKSGIPFLVDLPVVGQFFGHTTNTKSKREVIVVVTPHVLPLEQKYLSYVLPKDSDTFNRFGYKLFQNAYRIQGDEVFDFNFIYQSDALKNLLNRVRAGVKQRPELQSEEPFQSLLNGNIPGEQVLVHRMLWEIIDKIHYAQYVLPEHIIFFENRPDAPDKSGFQFTFLNSKVAGGPGQNALALTFDAESGTGGQSLVPPAATVKYQSITKQVYADQLTAGNDNDANGNPQHWTILLSDQYDGIRVSPAELLRGILVLKRVLELNSVTLQTLSDFHLGRQVIFPTEEELKSAHHIVDRDAARLFFEVFSYYPAFQRAFNRDAKRILQLLDEKR
jgi:general secretion pathway protein D